MSLPLYLIWYDLYLIKKELLAVHLHPSGDGFSFAKVVMEEG
jgi:hypothetical protein